MRRALTLVELLVVIAIIGILVALLLPRHPGGASGGATHPRANQIRQIGIAYHSYFDANRGNFPENMHADVSKSWVYTLAPFMESVDEIRICPEDPIGPERLPAKSTSFIVNEYVSSRTVKGSIKNIRQMKSTSKSMIMFEGSDARTIAFSNEHAHASSWYSNFNVKNGLVLYAIQNELQLDRHSDTAHYLFADAHVDKIESSQIAEWATGLYEFAKPQ